MERGSDSLSYAVRGAVLRYYAGQVAAVVALLTLVPAVVAVVQGELRVGTSLGLVIVLLGLCWLACRRAPSPRSLQANEALAIVALAFVVTPLLMALPFAVGGFSAADAVFESVSGLTTTGLSVVASVDDCGPGLLFLRSWLQWYGGLGIAVFSLALMLGHPVGARRLAGVGDTDDLPSSTRTYARRVLLVYSALTLVVFAALWPALGDGMQAALHTLSAVSTGGFSGYDDSLAGMPSAAPRWLTIAASTLCAVPLLVYYRPFARRRRGAANASEAWLLLLAIALTAGLLVLALRAELGMDWSAAAYHGAMLGASAQTTTGFSTMPVADVGDTGKLVLILSMFVGGGAGSTAGGIKLLRMLILMRLLAFALRRTTMPRHAVATLRLGGRKLGDGEVQRVLLVIVLFFAANLVSWLLLVAGNFPPLDALFEVVSATGTVGLSTGITGPELDTGYKLLLCVNMLLGRLEIIALLVVLYPKTWLGRRVETT